MSSAPEMRISKAEFAFQIANLDSNPVSASLNRLLIANENAHIMVSPSCYYIKQKVKEYNESRRSV